MSATHTYTGYIKSFGNVGFIAGINELKGMVEQATSPEGALQKLVLALRIRTSFVEKTDLNKIHYKVITGNSTEQEKSVAQKDLSLVLQ